jgi:hypothetical protein
MVEQSHSFLNVFTVVDDDFKNNLFVIYVTCKLPIVWKFKNHHVLLEFWVYHGVPDFTKVSRQTQVSEEKGICFISLPHRWGKERRPAWRMRDPRQVLSATFLVGWSR